MTDIWGLKNCDSCRNARRWLDLQGIDFRFHDLRDDPPGQQRLSRWLRAAGGEILVNRRGTTWKGLPARAKKQIAAADIVSVLAEYPALMKRPLLEYGERVLVGFDAAAYRHLFGTSK